MSRDGDLLLDGEAVQEDGARPDRHDHEGHQSPDQRAAADAELGPLPQRPGVDVQIDIPTSVGPIEVDRQQAEAGGPNESHQQMEGAPHERQAADAEGQ